MNEAKKTTISILALYMISTTLFLSIIFGVWYHGELNLLKTRSFHEVKNLSKRLIYVLAKRGKYEFFIQSAEGKRAILQSLSLESGYLIAAFNKDGELVYNNMKINPKDVPSENGTFIIDNHAVLNSFGRPDFLFDKEKTHPRPEDEFRIIIDGGDIGNLLWKLRLKIWGFFGVLLVMMGIVGYFLVRLSLRPLNQKIEELNSFIKDTTHEINTPLSVLQMSVDQIDKSLLQEKDRKKFNHIQVAARTLSNIYHSLIYTSFGRLENRIEVIDMQKLIQERLEFFELLFLQKNISVEVELQSVPLEANPKSIGLVIDNLLSNAYKYTPKNGKIQIMLCANQKQASLHIKDNGYGIDPSKINQIFDRYVRLDTTKGGFGLGLSIVKKICLEFKISISCKSEPKKGTDFLLEWEV